MASALCTERIFRTERIFPVRRGGRLTIGAQNPDGLGAAPAAAWA